MLARPAIGEIAKRGILPSSADDRVHDYQIFKEDLIKGANAWGIASLLSREFKAWIFNFGFRRTGYMSQLLFHST